MKKRGVLFLLLVALLGGGVWFFVRLREPPWIRLPVSISSDSGQPFFEIEIQGVKVPILVDLGSPTCLVLAEEIVEKIEEKTPYQGRSLIAMNGQDYFLEGYIVSDVRLRNLSIGKLEVSKAPRGFLGESGLLWEGAPDEKGEERFGELGCAFFEMLKMPLFLDMSRSVLYLQANFERLAKEGYRPKQWIKVPFTLGPFGIVLEAQMDQGTKRLVIDTGATYSLMPKRDNPQEFYTSSHFQMGGKEFGSQRFLLYPFPDLFSAVDGFLGMDFLQKHLVYIDFVHCLIYISPNEAL